MGEEVRLQNLTWEDVKARIDACKITIILPVGSTEQHGPHLPLGTDTMVAIVLAGAAAEKNDVLVAPPLWFGWSPLYNIDPRHTGDTLCYVPSSRLEMEKIAKVAGGTVGTPSKASREGGRDYHDYLVKQLGEVIVNLEKKG